MPDWGRQATRLRWLNVGSNQLTALPDWLVRFTQLRSLDLCSNQLTALPDWLGRLAQLRRLYLGGNLLTALPDGLAQLAQIRWLNVSDNQLIVVPNCVRQLTQLKGLDLGNCQLTALPDWLGQLTQLRALDLSQNQLMALPDWLGQLTQLEELYLFRRQLVALPDWLGQLTQLKRLMLSDNHLTVLPDWFGHLGQLEELYLSSNQLTAVPDRIGQLTQLRWLVLNDNRLTTLPEGLGQLSRLTQIDLCNNQLTILPDGVGQLTQLRWLVLNNNQLTALPDSLGALTELTVLEATDNRLADLPDALGSLPTLAELDVKSNPLSPALDEAAEQGCHRLLSYLRERAESSEQIWQAKVLLVGEGGHGKTCLLRALKGEGFVEDHLATPLLDVRSLRLPHPSLDVELDLRAWDFGGQDFYFATQQFFFTGKSLFLLVWNPCTDFERTTLKSWLDRIYALAPDSPVLLVATHGDQHTPSIPLAQLKEEYPNVVGSVFSVDSKSGRNLDALRDEVRQTASGLEHMGARYPSSWVRALEAIHGHPANYLPVEEFRELARAQGVKEVHSFLALMSHSGEVTYFSKNPIYHPEASELNDWVILKPAWLLQRISEVLTDPGIRTTVSFRSGDLQRLWPDLPGHVRPFLAKLTEHFDLAYHVDDDSDRHIVVELSPVDRPASVMDRSRARADGPKVAKAALVALRQLLMECAANEEDRWGGLTQVLLLKSQYLWVCAEHAKHPDYQG